MRIDQDCFLRGCAWHDHRSKDPTVEVVRKDWVGLTDQDFLEACQIAERGNYLVAFQKIQAKLKEKNA
jgi:hypothetical protein